MINFGAVADCQYADLDNLPELDRHWRDSGQRRIGEAVETFNSEDLAFVIHLGDLVECDLDNSAVPLAALATSTAPVHHVIGNHDFNQVRGGVTVNTLDEILDRYQMPGPYYSFTVTDPDGPTWRFVCCNSNEDSPIGHAHGTAESDARLEVMRAAAEAGAINAVPWNGKVSQQQRVWLFDQLRQATDAGERVIVFVHHQPYPVRRPSMIDGPEFAAELEKWDCVRAVFSGHNHDGDYGQFRRLHCVTLHGMVETPVTAYATVTLTDDEIVVTGHGRQPSYRLLPAAEQPLSPAPTPSTSASAAAGG